MIGFFNQCVQFFNFIINFINALSYDFFIEAMDVYVIYLQIAFIDFKEYSVVMFADFSKDIIAQLNLSSALASSFAALDSKLVSMLFFFNIPTAINAIISALISRFTLSFLRI